MANQLGGFIVAPRAYTRHQRHRKLARVGTGADQFAGFLAAMVAKYTQSTSAVFNKLPKNSADRMRATASFGSLT